MDPETRAAIKEVAEANDETRKMLARDLVDRTADEFRANGMVLTMMGVLAALEVPPGQTRAWVSAINSKNWDAIDDATEAVLTSLRRKTHGQRSLWQRLFRR
jgi:hypothetical protein